LPLVDTLISDGEQSCSSQQIAKVIFPVAYRETFTSAATYVLNQAVNGESVLFLESLCFLHPAQIFKPNTVHDLLSVAQNLPILLKTHLLLDEFKLLQKGEFP